MILHPLKTKIGRYLDSHPLVESGLMLWMALCIVAVIYGVVSLVVSYC